MSLISSSDINKLTCVQQSIEKSIYTIIEHLKKFTDYEDISELLSLQETERQTDRGALQSSVKEIMDNIKFKIIFLKQNKSMDNAALKQFKCEMILIQDSIQSLMKSSKSKLKALQIEYIDINQDVDYYNEKMFEWSEPANINNNFICNLNYKRPNPALKCVEMREFIDFVRRSGGHENGWDRNDHHLFLKLRNKYKDIAVIAEKLNEILPDKDITEIKQHEEWFKKYLILKNNKKSAIKKWKELKKTKLNSIRTDENPKHSKSLYCQEDLQEKLIKWKIEKEIKFKNEFRFDCEIERKRKDLELLRKKKNEEVKKIVEEWKKAKISLGQDELMRRKIKEDNEKKKRGAEANKLIKQFQSQDDYYILKMKQKKSRNQLKPVRSKSSQLGTRDPDRLLKPTEQWINRVHDENIYPKETVIPLKKLPKLGIPEWRKNL